MPKYIVVIAIGEDHPCLFSELQSLVLCKDLAEVQATIPYKNEEDDEDFDWMIFEIVPGSNKPKQCAITFKNDGRTIKSIKSISSNGIHPEV
jgi:hypothetical protein